MSKELENLHRIATTLRVKYSNRITDSALADALNRNGLVLAERPKELCLRIVNVNARGVVGSVSDHRIGDIKPEAEFCRALLGNDDAVEVCVTLRDGSERVIKKVWL